LAFYQSVKEEVDAYVSEKIGTATQSISAEKSLWEDSEYMDFIHQLQLDLTGADVSFASPVSALAGIEEGPVEVRDMFRLFPHEYQLYAVEMTGKEIDSYLEYSYGIWFSILDGTRKHMLKYLAETEAPVGFSEIPTELYDSAAGIFYEVDISRQPGDRVTITGIGRQKKPVNPEKTYLAAVSSYRGNGGGGHLTLGAGIPQEELHDRIIFSTLQDMRLYALRLFSYIGTYTPVTDSNWVVYPENWVSEAKKVDMDALEK
jgi:2',3'-cyclic-nucleotide 2'-phosphodiesterase / 3'-nucleotidase